MGYFILKQSWSVLYYIRFLGIYPIQNDGDETGIKLTSTCEFWLRYICTLLFGALLHGSIHLYLYFVEDVNPKVFLNTAMGRNSETGIDNL